MTCRKSEITSRMNERDFPHLVERAFPPGGFCNRSLEFDAFHYKRDLAIRRGRGRHEEEQFYVRFYCGRGSGPLRGYSGCADLGQLLPL